MAKNLSPYNESINTVESNSGDNKPIRSDRNNNFNLIRLLLATLVIVAHSPELIDGDRRREILTSIFHTLSFGEIAVNGFFLLSGYLIVQSWDRAPVLLDFLKKRVLRIYPGFIAATLVCAVIVGPLGSNFREYFAHLSWFSLLKGIAILKSPNVPEVFKGSHFAFVNAPMWTIKYEFRCYLTVALFGLCGMVKNRNFWLATFVASLLLYINHSFLGHLHFPGKSFLLGDDAIRLFMCFSAGGCFYLFRDRIVYKPVVAAIFAPIVILSLFTMKLAEPALVTLGAYILFWFAFAPIPALDRLKKLPDVSYGIYLYGWPSQKLLLWYFPTLSPWLLTLLALCSSFICGLLSWYLVEKPFLTLKPRQKSPETVHVN